MAENKEEEKILAERKKTQSVINASNMLNAANSSLLPVVVNQISSTTGIGLGSLSVAISIGTFLQNVSTPLWGWWSDHYSRTKVLAIGCFIWGLFTLLTGFSLGYIDMLAYRIICGIGLAVIVPTTNSLIGDYFPPENRGKAYGLLGAIGGIGMIIGIVFTTAVVSLTPQILGIDSWRFCFFFWGFISIGLTFLILFTVKDPKRGLMDSGTVNGISLAQSENVKMNIKDYIKIFKNKTFLLIVLQGIAGSIPWNGIMLMITWFEYVGFSPLTGGLVVIVVGISAAGGSILGGVLGDKAAKWNPRKGRIMVAQISVFAGIPFILILLLVIPMNTNSIFLYVITGMIMGLTMTWSANAANSPIFTELFEPEIRSSVFSVDRLLENLIASFGTVFVMLFAKMFGFVDPGVGVDVSSLPMEGIRQTNMMALAYGMLITAVIPWLLCVILYSFVYLTYPKDLAAIKKRMEERALETNKNLLS
jgi:MFS family permease